MVLRTANRRLSVRMAVANAVVVLDEDGCVLARGRTANICENGVFVIAKVNTAPPKTECVIVELTMPSASGSPRPMHCRIVRFRGRVIRTVSLGRLIGMGIEILEELPADNL